MKHRSILTLLCLFTLYSAALTTSASVVSSQTGSRGMQVKKGEKAEQRVALVIGNSAYKDSPLLNPVNDARQMARALREVGFEVVLGENLSQIDMKRQIRLFGDKIRGGGVGLFYYAGHGIQFNGRNYLIPVNAAITKEAETEYEAVDLGFVLAQMEEARNMLNIVILDACRNNPFARSFRSSKSGLASVDAPSGTLIAYATAPGSIASDGRGKNGLYTQELLKYMRLPGVSIERVFKKVRIAVIDQTKGAQTPWESSSLVGDFYFTVTTTVAKPESSPAQPIRPETYFRQGDALADQKKWAEAEEAYQMGLALEPENPWYSFRLYMALSNQNKADKYNAQAIALQRLKRWDEIERVAQRLVKDNPMSASRHWELGSAFMLQKKDADAEAEFRKAIGIEPNIAMFHSHLGIALRGQKKYSEAEAEIRRAIAIEPNTARWRTSLGLIFYYQQKYKLAEAEFRRAVSLEPATATFHHYLGISLASQNKYAEAEAECRKAITIEPDTADFQYNLGVTLASQNKYAEAEVAFRKAIDLAPDNKEYKEALEKLDKVKQ